jgi:hypothetical protein
MARYALAALGVEPTELAIREHVELFLNALTFAHVRELLTGRPDAEGGADTQPKP